MSMSYDRGPYECSAYAPEELARHGLDATRIRQIFGAVCGGCGCYHQCAACGNSHCGCPADKACVASFVTH